MATALHLRGAWGGLPARLAPVIASEALTLHHGGSTPWGVPGVDRSSAARFYETTEHARCASILRAWQAFHMTPEPAGRGWSDLAYNAAVCPHGVRYDARGPGRRSGANGTNDGNRRSCAVVYIAGTGDPLTDQAKAAFIDESERFQDPLRWQHSDWKNTECAGSPIRAWQTAGWPSPTTDQGDDLLSALTDQEQRELHDWTGLLFHHLIGSDVPAWGDQNPRHNSVVTRLKYLFGESIGGSNLDEFRSLLDTAVQDSANVGDLVDAVAKIESDLLALSERLPAPPPAPV